MLEDDLLAKVGQIRKKGLTIAEAVSRDMLYRLADVYVTDASAPLHLVLQSEYRTLWRVLQAPGVEVAHIAIVGRNATALISPPQGATLESISSDGPREFGRSDVGYSDIFSGQWSSDMPECFPLPYRDPNESWDAWSGSAKGRGVDRNLITKYQLGHAAYSAWYKRQLGVAASDNTVSASFAAHVMVGPKPSEPVAFTTGDPKVIAVGSGQTAIAGDAATISERVLDVYESELLAATGGDIGILTPSVVTRGD
ncbi:MAG: hypothetical protein AAF367_02080 [Pseudomonadota bacterium]